MMKKLILIILGLFLITFISATDEQMIVSCGGDDELIIGCPISDEQLTFIGGVPSVTAPGGGGGYEDIVNITAPTIPPPEKKIDWILIIGIMMTISLFIFILWKRRKEEKEGKRKKKKKGNKSPEIENPKPSNK